MEKEKTIKFLLRFINSCRFLNTSLGSLIDNLAGTNTDGLKCCEGKGLELVKIDREYVVTFECEKCEKITTRQLDQRELEMRFSNLRSRYLNNDHFRLFLRRRRLSLRVHG